MKNYLRNYFMVQVADIVNFALYFGEEKLIDGRKKHEICENGCE